MSEANAEEAAHVDFIVDHDPSFILPPHYILICTAMNEADTNVEWFSIDSQLLPEDGKVELVEPPVFTSYTQSVLKFADEVRKTKENQEKNTSVLVVSTSFVMQKIIDEFKSTSRNIPACLGHFSDIHSEYSKWQKKKSGIAPTHPITGKEVEKGLSLSTGSVLEILRTMIEATVALLKSGHTFESSVSSDQHPQRVTKKETNDHNSVVNIADSFKSPSSPVPFERKEKLVESGGKVDRGAVEPRAERVKNPPIRGNDVGEKDSSGGFVVRLRGLPWQITEKDIVGFFSGLVLIPDGIFFRRDNTGRPTGEGFVRLGSQHDCDEALGRHKHYIGKRYIEVFSSTMDEWQRALAGSNMGGHGGNGGGMDRDRRSSRSQKAPFDYNDNRREKNDFSGNFVIRMRGLPFTCRIDDVLDFFHDIDLVRNDVYIITKPSGSCSGDAYVKVLSSRQFSHAMSHHNSRIGRRYIELFKSSIDELDSVLSRSTFMRSSPPPPRSSFQNDRYNDRGRYAPYQGGPPPSDNYRSSGGPPPSYYPRESNTLRLRGLPYNSNPYDIEQFFNGIQILRDGIHIQGGEAMVEFRSDEDKRVALSKHNQRIGSRFIEIFQASEEEFSRFRSRRGPGSGSERSFGGPPPSHYSTPPIDPNLVRMLQNTDPRASNPYGPPPTNNYPDQYNRRDNYPGGPPPPSNYPPQQPPPHGYSSAPSYHPTNYHPPNPSYESGGSVVIRGLTALVTIADIQRYFVGYQIIPDSIQVASNVERTVFEATVRFSSASEAGRVMKEKGSGFIGDTYVKLYEPERNVSRPPLY